MNRIRSACVVLASASLALSAGAGAAQGSDCHVPPLQFWLDFDGPPSGGEISVTGDGNYMYYVDSALKIYDISDPTSPVRVGSNLSAPGYAVEIRGNLAYIGGKRSLRIADITNPASPVLLGVYVQSPGGSSFGVNPFGLGDNLAIVIGSNTSSIQIIDITNPSAPTGILNFPMGAPVNDVAISGDTAFVATTNGLIVLDLSTPASPVALTTYLPGTSVSAPVVNGGTLFLYANETVEAIDISAPASPVSIGSIAVLNSANGMEAKGDRLITARGEVIDISNPAAMTVVDRVGYIGYSLDAGISGDWAFVATLYTGLYGVRLDDHPSFAPTYVSASSVNEDLVVSGNYVLAANGNAGVEIIDATDPDAPVVVGSIDTPGTARGIDVSGSIACVADYSGGLQIIDFSNPADPVIVGSTPVLGENGDVGYALDVTIVGSNAYVATRGNDSTAFLSSVISIVDISNPSSPVILSTINDNPFGSTWVHSRIDSDGNLLAVLTMNYNSSTGSFPTHSCRLIDVTDPMAPVVGAVSGPHTGSNGTDILIRDGLVRTVNNGAFETMSTLKTFTYTPSLNMQLVDEIAFGPTIFSMYARITHKRIAIGDGVMYAAIGEGGNTYSIAEYDLSDPVSPKLVGIYPTGGEIGSVGVSGSVVVFGRDSSVGFVDFAPCTGCLADVNGDGSLTPDDFTAWIAAFSAASPECDQNGDGLCSPGDFTAWIANFNAGC